MSANAGSAEPSATPSPEDFAGSTVAAKQGGSIEARLLRRLLSSLGNPPIEFHFLWSGERVTPYSVRPIEHVRIADRRTLLGLVFDPQIRFGEAFSSGRLEVEGDVVKFMVTLFKIFERPDSRPSISSRITNLVHRTRRNTLEGSRHNIHRHYDLGNDFYSLWLGETMAYTCAYYTSAQATLDQAQIAKMD